MASKGKALDLGRRGEDLAAEFFIRRGFTIVARNWHCRGGELDLVVFKGEELRVIEVKTRRSSTALQPWETVTDVKLERIGTALARFLAAHAELPDEAHIDVLAISFTRAGTPVYRWLKDFE
jgi:putative endonuclease